MTQWPLAQLGAHVPGALDGQPVMCELDDTGAVARLVAQPLGIFLPKPLA